jgi:hypothetical protein
MEASLKGNKLSETPRFRDSPIVQEMSARYATWKVKSYPQPGVNEVFESIKSRLVIRKAQSLEGGHLLRKGNYRRIKLLDSTRES